MQVVHQEAFSRLKNKKLAAQPKRRQLRRQRPTKTITSKYEIFGEIEICKNNYVCQRKNETFNFHFFYIAFIIIANYSAPAMLKRTGVFIFHDLYLI